MKLGDINPTVHYFIVSRIKPTTYEYCLFWR